MTRPEIEPRSPRPLANTQTITSMGLRLACFTILCLIIIVTIIVGNLLANVATIMGQRLTCFIVRSPIIVVTISVGNLYANLANIMGQRLASFTTPIQYFSPHLIITISFAFSPVIYIFLLVKICTSGGNWPFCYTKAATESLSKNCLRTVYFSPARFVQIRNEHEPGGRVCIRWLLQNNNAFYIIILTNNVKDRCL